MKLKKREQEQHNARQATFPDTLQNIHRDDWPPFPPVGLSEVWRSSRFLVQVYWVKNGAARVSVNRVTVGRHGVQDGITWDELQEIKRQIGRASTWAVEVFPDDSELVNVANMRHLWLLPEAPPFAWRVRK